MTIPFSCLRYDITEIWGAEGKHWTEGSFIDGVNQSNNAIILLLTAMKQKLVHGEYGTRSNKQIYTKQNIGLSGSTDN